MKIENIYLNIIPNMIKNINSMQIIWGLLKLAKK